MFNSPPSFPLSSSKIGGGNPLIDIDLAKIIERVENGIEYSKFEKILKSWHFLKVSKTVFTYFQGSHFGLIFKHFPDST